MGKSFVLRDAAGTAAGCLMQGMNALHLRLRGAKETDEIALLMGDGTWKHRQIGKCGEQGEWALEACTAEGVVILRDGEILADSGSEAKLRYARMKKKTVRMQEKTEKKKELETEERKEDGLVHRAKNKEAALPERRWPPPPCMGLSVYRGGVWTTENE